MLRSDEDFRRKVSLKCKVELLMEAVGDFLDDRLVKTVDLNAFSFPVQEIVLFEAIEKKSEFVSDFLKFSGQLEAFPILNAEMGAFEVSPLAYFCVDYVYR